MSRPRDLGKGRQDLSRGVDPSLCTCHSFRYRSIPVYPGDTVTQPLLEVPGFRVRTTPNLTNSVDGRFYPPRVAPNEPGSVRVPHSVSYVTHDLLPSLTLLSDCCPTTESPRHTRCPGTPPVGTPPVPPGLDRVDVTSTSDWPVGL